MGMKTISIATQSSAEELMVELCAALANELGDRWMMNSDYEVINADGVGFTFSVASSNNVALNVKGLNLSSTLGTNTTGTTAVYTQPAVLDICKSKNGSVIAVGIHGSNITSLTFKVFVAENEAGEWVACYGSTGTEYNTIHGEDMASKKAKHIVNYGSGTPCALYKCPDIFAGQLFKELFAVYSSPSVDAAFQASDGDTDYFVFNINGSTTNSPMFAIPV